MGRRTPLPRPGHPRPRTPDHHPRHDPRRGGDYRPVPGPDRLNTSRITPNRYTTPEDLTTARATSPHQDEVPDDVWWVSHRTDGKILRCSRDTPSRRSERAAGA